ncbi:MAG TPA: 3-hydroxyacyl-CoA dehydrogenase/enoyl-CoA hydratase family protein [Casimicrobiaceae bacterium]|nr:3-hydroxyacyl-CoA dehydrogenase/enoyl-CoA hydratase family protein [Casimicrobiaceae bacterium]
MPHSPFLVRKAAVLGAGVMGAQIAAHFANAGIPALLFDLPAKEGDPYGIVDKAIANLARLDPAPLGAKDRVQAIEACHYGADTARIAECDLVIEAIGERLEWKKDLYGKIAGSLAPHAVLASNTSGLSLAALSQTLPDAVRPRFCGVHFFNPPRYMHLVELTPAPGTDEAMLDALHAFLMTGLGKGVIRARDTPNFIANRIGVFSIIATMRHTQNYGLSFDVVDALTGPAIGRAKSATYRTADVVGLDTLAHVVKTMEDTLPSDPWHAHFATPPVLAALVAQGALGAKTKAGYFRKVGRDIEVLDPVAREYRKSVGEVAPEVAQILAIKSPGEKFAKLRALNHPQAQFLWAIFRDLFHYSAYHLAEIADNARHVDLAMRWGFGWQSGPFETWQAAGWKDVAGWIGEDVAQGRALANVPLPAWVSGPKVSAASGVHTTEGAYSPARDAFVPRRTLPVYQRQLFPDPVLGERPANTGATIFETDAVRMWHLGDDVGIVSFKTKANTVSQAVLDGLQRAVEVAERECAGLVVWQPREPFSLGANLAELGPAIEAKQWGAIEGVVAKFQQTAMRLRGSLVPVVCAVRGMALGGSCEFIMHSARTVAALESYIGLPEAGVGILPAGGGCKELVVRAAEEVRRGAAGSQIDPLPFIRTYFQSVATATVSKSALEAKEVGYLRPSDVVVMHALEVLHVAKRQALALADAGYRPPLPARNVPVVGKTGLATLTMMLVNMRDGGFISAYDFEVSRQIARVLCGGEVDAGSLVDEGWLLALEREGIMTLLRDERTQARIAHTLATGKPLRN